MSNKNNVKGVGGENIREMMEMGGITKTLNIGKEGDIDAGECVMTTAPSTNNKEEESDGRDVMENLGKLASKKQAQVRISMIVLRIAQ